MVVDFLAVVVARLRVVVLAAGLASTVTLALDSAGVSSTLAAGFVAALVVAAFVVVDFVVVVFLAAVAFLAVAVVFLVAALAGAFAAALASTASAFTSGAASASAAFLAAAVVRLREVVVLTAVVLAARRFGRCGLLSRRLTSRGLLSCRLCSWLDLGLCLRSSLSLHLRLGRNGLSFNRLLFGLGLLSGHRLSNSLRLVDNSHRALDLRVHKEVQVQILVGRARPAKVLAHGLRDQLVPGIAVVPEQACRTGTRRRPSRRR